MKKNSSFYHFIANYFLIWRNAADGHNKHPLMMIEQFLFHQFQIIPLNFFLLNFYINNKSSKRRRRSESRFCDFHLWCIMRKYLITEILMNAKDKLKYMIEICLIIIKNKLIYKSFKKNLTTRIFRCVFWKSVKIRSVDGISGF